MIANPGTIISILNGPDVTLPGSNGGIYYTDHRGIRSGFPVCDNNCSPLPNYLDIGGTIAIGNTAANPPGDYSGTYEIILCSNNNPGQDI